MNRVIKFRGFFNNKMYYPATTHEYKNIVFSSGEQVAFTNDEKKKMSIMQFTELKDKNGVEIYEGDILQWTQIYSGHIWSGSDFKDEPVKGKGQVRFSDGAFTLGYPLKIDAVKHGYVERGDNHALRWETRYFDFEVIGNIHEHPHLLNS